MHQTNENNLIDHLDHLVLTTRDKTRCIHFYCNVLGMSLESFGEDRIAFCFGNQKINLHEYGKEFSPKAHLPVPGSLDLCFITSAPMDDILRKLANDDVTVIDGPVKRTGALWPIRSIYVRDPDLNLIEIAERW